MTGQPDETIIGILEGDDWACPCGAEGNGGRDALARHGRVLHGARQIIPLDARDVPHVRGPVVPDDVDSHLVRAWARENGWPQLGDRGRMPQAAIDAYLEAHP